jgi:hypothetical protein
MALGLAVTAIVIIALLAGGVLLWHSRRPATEHHQSAPPNTTTEAAGLTPETLRGKQFHFTWRNGQEGGDRGILTLNNDGTINRIGNFHETSWFIDPAGQLVLKFPDGHVSTIFTNAELRNGKWFFAGRFRDMEQLLEEAGPELVARENGASR